MCIPACNGAGCIPACNGVGMSVQGRCLPRGASAQGGVYQTHTNTHTHTHTHTPEMATEAGATHPTGMHSCFNSFQCSYTPNEDCKYSTENYFKSRGAFEGKEYLCFYSTSIPLKVLLEKNEDVGTSAFIVPCVILVLGIALLVTVKFFGHKFNCPSQSQLLKQQQEQHQQQQQLQPLNQPQVT